MLTKKRRGRIPIPPELIPHLRRARLRGSDLGPVLHISGRPIQNIKKGFGAACKRAGREFALLLRSSILHRGQEVFAQHEDAEFEVGAKRSPKK